MERDLLFMIYGAIMGVVGSIVTSIVTALVHLWLDRREYQRRQSEEHDRQLKRIHIPTDEEILLQRRQVSTSYSYFAGVGITYTFGSIFNNVVNPRFEGANGTFYFF